MPRYFPHNIKDERRPVTTGSQVLVTRATDHSVLDEWSEDGPFWIFWVFEFAVHRVVSGGLPHLGSEQRTEQFWKCSPI